MSLKSKMPNVLVQEHVWNERIGNYELRQRVEFQPSPDEIKGMVKVAETVGSGLVDFCKLFGQLVWYSTKGAAVQYVRAGFAAANYAETGHWYGLPPNEDWNELTKSG